MTQASLNTAASLVLKSDFQFMLKEVKPLLSKAGIKATASVISGNHEEDFQWIILILRFLQDHGEALAGHLPAVQTFVSLSRLSTSLDDTLPNQAEMDAIGSISRLCQAEAHCTAALTKHLGNLSSSGRSFR